MWDCGRCGCQAIAAGLRVCPVCRADREDDMPKATVTGGASNGEPAPEEQEPGQSEQVGQAGQQMPEPPGSRASKAELVEHAVNVAGVDPDAAASMTKPELVKAIADAVPPPPAPGE